MTNEADVDIVPLSANEEGLTSEETTLLARIPLLSGSSKKAAYLAFRSCGFTINQSVQLAKCTRGNLNYWRKTDPTFKKFEETQLERLQKTVGNEVVKFEFMRNFRMLLNFDAQLISKAMVNVNIGDAKTEGLSPREFELFKLLRKFYTPADMLALEKILNPEKHKEGSGPVNIVLSWGGRLENNTPQLTASVVEGEFNDIDPI